MTREGAGLTPETRSVHTPKQPHGTTHAGAVVSLSGQREQRPRKFEKTLYPREEDFPGCNNLFGILIGKGGANKKAMESGGADVYINGKSDGVSEPHTGA